MKMNTIKRTFLRRLATSLLLLGVTTHLLAAEWPERPIKLVVPYPPGGLTDIVSRLVADEVGKILGTSVVIDNKAGAGGQIGLQAVLQAPRDGYTIALVVPATMVTLPLTNPDYKIKPLEQFEPITVAVDTFLTLVVDRKLGIQTMTDFTAYARKNPGKLNYGTPGAGTSFHFNNVIMAQKLGIEAVHVPYKGEVQMLTDIVGGQLQYALVSNTAKPFIDSGQVVAIAVTSDKRVASLPKVPTFKEGGVNFTSEGWVGYVAGTGTPAPILAKLNAAFVKALNTPSVKLKLTDMGYAVVGNTPAQFRSIVQESTRHYAELVRSGAVKTDK
jgi:tripartite-type tricarboxylate transporter receptor subunit TctC